MNRFCRIYGISINNLARHWCVQGAAASCQCANALRALALVGIERDRESRSQVSALRRLPPLWTALLL